MPAPQWTLRTRTTDYVVSLLEDGSGLTLDFWGAHTTAPISPWAPVDPVPPFEHRLDTAPLEFASAGQRQNAFAELLIDRPNGLTGAVWAADAAGIRFETSPNGDALEVPFDDETGTLRLTLHTVTRAQHDVVRRWMTIENRGQDPVELPRAFSAAWNVLASRAVEIHYLAGRWIQENQQRTNSLAWGAFSIGSRQGITSHAFAPTVTLVPAIDPDVRSAVPPGAWGVALEWSGNWRLQVDSNPMGQRGVRVSCGVDDDTTTVVLDAGERFEAPASAGVFSARGPEGVSAAWHEYQRLELARDLGVARHPVVYNSWFSTEFDVRIDHQLALARRARDLGVEAFVLDDGWFRGRTSDHAGLGDWQPDPTKFPNGLAELADGVTALGMDFGLWIEPEMVNPDSDLYRAHPDWVYRAGDRPLLTNRHQYVLDLGRPEVEAWAAETLRAVLGSANIRYLKWDMNRSITDGGRPGDRHGREWSVQHTLAYYRLMRLVREEFPHVTVEACSGGGGRVDHGVLGLADVVWVSDETGPRDRLTIQHGYLSAYPAHTMLSIVTAHPGLRTPDRVSLAYRFAMGMTGVLGLGTDLLAWGDEELAEAARWITRYKDIRDVVLRGEVATHGAPNDHRYAVEFAGDDGRIVLVVFSHDAERGGNRTGLPPRVYPTLLRSDQRYRVAETGQLVDRSSAAIAGVEVPFLMAPDVDVLVLEPVGRSDVFTPVLGDA
jgi:alpha-galactosidase